MAIDREFQVLVVGGGVAGLATAGFLAGAGLEPVVVERDRALDAPAGPVELPPDAVTLLSWLDATADVRAAGTAVRSWTLRGEDGGVRHRLDAGDGPGLLAVDHGRLRGVLADALPPGTVRTGTAVRGVDDAGDRVRVALDGGVTEVFDVVVGADGARSTVRADLGGDPPGRPPTTSVAFPLDGDPAVEGAAEQWTADGAVLRVVPAGGQPWGWLTVPTPPAHTRAALRERLVAHLEATGWLGDATAGAFLAHDDVAADAAVPAGPRVALVGDAARAPHRLAGVGPTLALEDAAALAAALTDPGTPLADRIATYERRRRSRPDFGTGSGAPAGPLAGLVEGLPAPLAAAARVRSARLAAGFAGTEPAPRVQRPRPGR